MRLPQITTSDNRASSITDRFLGVNQNMITSRGEWAAMKNMCDQHYPAISTRPARGTVEKTFENPKGIFYKNGLFYIDGTKAYYKDKEVFTVTDGDKKLVGIGAYICVFPDHIIFNTFTGAVDHMTAKVSGSAVFAPLSKGSVFTKITLAGIGNTFKTGDNVTISGASNSEYNGTKVITDGGTDYIIVTGSLTDQFTSTATFERKVPDMDFITERDNRLWGCSSKNHEVYCCKVGDPKNWYNYEKEANNAWAATVGSDGDFTGISKYGTYLVFFKESTFHVLRGDKPSNFSLLEKTLPGVRAGCDRSLVTINETLYYVSRDGVYRYLGGVPEKISTNITQEITDATAAQYDGKLYLSCKLGGAQTLLVYDPLTSVWDVEDDATFKFVQYSEGMLHYVDAENNLRDIYGSDTEPIRWFLESGDLRGSAMEQKYVSKVLINFVMPVGSEVKFFAKFDDGPMWEQKGFIRSAMDKTYTIPIIPRRCSKYRIRIEGTGPCKIVAMANTIELGSEINGYIHTGYRR